jgi:hypothetical protein
MAWLWRACRRDELINRNIARTWSSRQLRLGRRERPEEAPTRGAGSASGRAGKALERSGRLTINRPRMAGSDLREARAAAASLTDGARAAAGEARLATVAGMGTAEAPGAAASPWHVQTPPLHATGRGGKRTMRGGPIWSRRSEKMREGGDQAGGATSSPLDAMVAACFKATLFLNGVPILYSCIVVRVGNKCQGLKLVIR